MMVYCDLIKADAQSATYNFGVKLNDMSGIVIFHKYKDEPEIIRLPEDKEAAISMIRKLNARHRKDFAQGIFKEKVSFECG